MLVGVVILVCFDEVVSTMCFSVCCWLFVFVFAVSCFDDFVYADWFGLEIGFSC